MIVDDLHLIGAIIAPDEDQPPLIVDANRMKASPIARQGLKPISGRRLQIVETARRIEHFELSLGGPRNALELFHPLVPKQSFGFLAGKRSNHGALYRIPVCGQGKIGAWVLH